MTTAEILWMVHEDTVEYLKEYEPRKVRKYLIEMGDEEALRAYDAEMMKSSANN